jgi:ankyrin repeat protein
MKFNELQPSSALPLLRPYSTNRQAVAWVRIDLDFAMCRSSLLVVSALSLPGQDGVTSLIVASSNGDIDIVRLLLGKGASVYAATRNEVHREADAHAYAESVLRA